MSAARDELIARLSEAERRLGEHVAAEDHGLPGGLTKPDPGGTERWEAGQVWAHLAEFPTYWWEQLQRIMAGTDAREPVPFGRVRTDAGRLAAIERDRHSDPAALLRRVQAGVATVVDGLRSLPDEAWTRVGRHPTLGDVTIGFAVERFIVGHLEEHVAQLDELRHAQA
jgi:hypothetical protein